MALVSDSLRNFVPNHSRGMKILLVDDDTPSLLHLTKMLREFSYNVTPTTSASCALFLVQEAVENPYQLVMASYNVPDMISLSFLRTMSQKDIPVIFLFSETSAHSDVLKVIGAGAHSFLMKPIAPVHLKYVWQPASIKMVERQRKGTEQLQNNLGEAVTIEDSGEERWDSKRRRMACGEDRTRVELHHRPQVWTQERQQRFLTVLAELGEQSARPKLVHEMMQVPELTVRQVASHLQKHRIEVRRTKENGLPVPALAPQIEPSPSCAAPSTAINNNTLPMATTELTDQLRRLLLEQDPEDLESRLDPHLVDEYCNYLKSLGQNSS